MNNNKNDLKGLSFGLRKQALNFALLVGLSAISIGTYAQEERQLSIDEAVKLGLDNSKSLKLQQQQIDEAVSRFNQAKDRALPTASASYTYNHAMFLSRQFDVPGNNKPFELPRKADAFIGTLSVKELIFGGNALKYAKESTSLLTDIAKLDADKQKDEIAYKIISEYYNLYKVQQSKMVVEKNLASVDQQLKQAQQFFSQGIVTKNDVLRFQLQKNNIQMTGVDLETNRKIINYNLNILLGLPENTSLQASGVENALNHHESLTSLLDSALGHRQEIKSYDLRSQLAETNIKSIKGGLLPTVSAAADLYYINPSAKVIPPSGTFLAPVSLGATVAWSFDKLWTNKNKVAEAKIKQDEANTGKLIAIDDVKEEVNRNYQNYLSSISKIDILENSILQAEENDRILASKYKNNIASVTDRIDAQTQLFQSQINLELAKADAGLAWYTLLKSTGNIK